MQDALITSKSSHPGRQCLVFDAGQCPLVAVSEVRDGQLLGELPGCVTD